MCALDESRNVGDYETAVFGIPHDSKVWDKGGERIVRDLWTCRGNCSDQGRFAGIGKSDETDVRQQLEFEPQLVFLANGASLKLRRHPIGGRGKMAVASPAFAAVRNCDGVPVRDQVRKLVASVEVI